MKKQNKNAFMYYVCIIMSLAFIGLSSCSKSNDINKSNCSAYNVKFNKKHYTKEYITVYQKFNF